jgi:ferredoxin/flavodoxin---NADP+ reductase
LESEAPVGLAKPPPEADTRFTIERVIAVHHWTPNLVSFQTTRALAFRFTPGNYTRVGLGRADGNLVWRPFSVVSAASDSHLEFVATLVPGGQFSDLLAGIREGNPMRVDKSSYGFLTIDHFAPGKDLWLLASGTGLGPFVSILRDTATWAAFRTVVVVHSVRHACELAYLDKIAAIPDQESIAIDPERLKYLPVVTRESCPGALNARIPQLIEEGRLESAAGVSLDPRRSRIMVCGNPDLGHALRRQLTARDFHVNRRTAPGQLAFENYWQGTPS